MTGSDRKLPLHAFAHGRAGDKGNTSNISVIAYRPADWPLILEQVTAERARMASVLSNLPDLLGELIQDGSAREDLFRRVGIPDREED